MNKLCPGCKTEKAHSDFARNARNKDGLQTYCRPCQNGYFQRNPGHQTVGYGFGDRYEALLAEQNGVCAICEQPCKTGRRLAIDHDRACCFGNKSCGLCVRGLLCFADNRLLGRHEKGRIKDPMLVDKLDAYLDAYAARRAQTAQVAA